MDQLLHTFRAKKTSPPSKKDATPPTILEQTSPASISIRGTNEKPIRTPTRSKATPHTDLQ